MDQLKKGGGVGVGGGVGRVYLEKKSLCRYRIKTQHTLRLAVIRMSLYVSRSYLDVSSDP